jgi:hypothetical protein
MLARRHGSSLFRSTPCPTSSRHRRSRRWTHTTIILRFRARVSTWVLVRSSRSRPRPEMHRVIGFRTTPCPDGLSEQSLAPERAIGDVLGPPRGRPTIGLADAASTTLRALAAEASALNNGFAAAAWQRCLWVTGARACPAAAALDGVTIGRSQGSSRRPTGCSELEPDLPRQRPRVAGRVRDRDLEAHGDRTTQA